MSTPAEIVRANTQTARHLLDILHTRLTPTIASLDLQASALDGYKKIASGGNAQPGGSGGDSIVERDGLNRLGETDESETGEGYFDRAPIAALYEAADLSTTLIKTLRMLLDWCDTHNNTRLTASELNALRCMNWRADDRNSCGNFHAPRRHNGQTVDDRRCLPCGALHDELDDIRRRESNERRLRRHHTNGGTS